MADSCIAKFEFKVFRQQNGDLTATFNRPDINALEKYDYYRLLLLAGEFISHVKNQLMYLNVDPDNKIYKMANVMIDHEMWKKMLEDKRLEDEKGMADVDKYQTQLPFKQCTYEETGCGDCTIPTKLRTCEGGTDEGDTT